MGENIANDKTDKGLTFNIYKTDHITRHQKNKQSNSKMGRRNEQIFFQRGDKDGQQAHEKMLNIANHQGNANQNHNEISPHICQNGYHQKEHK